MMLIEMVGSATHAVVVAAVVVAVVVAAVSCVHSSKMRVLAWASVSRVVMCV